MKNLEMNTVTEHWVQKFNVKFIKNQSGVNVPTPAILSPLCLDFKNMHQMKKYKSRRSWKQLGEIFKKMF